MKGNKIVLDASAVFAMIQVEPGGDRVDALLDEGWVPKPPTRMASPTTAGGAPKIQRPQIISLEPLRIWVSVVLDAA
jgi:hypothetical protein